MTATSLNAGAIEGVLTGSNVSQGFTPNQNDGFYVRVWFSSDAVGSLTVTRSTDGTSFAPMMAGSRVISTRSTNGHMRFFEASAATLWRIEANLSAGSAGYYILQGYMIRDYSESSTETMQMLNIGSLKYLGSNPSATMTASQVQSLFTNQWTPLSDADLAGDLTVYKLCKGNLLAKLLIPAAAKRAKGVRYMLGGGRDIRAEYVDVFSVFDGNGNQLASATSSFDPATVYTSGSRTVARDLYGTQLAGFDSPSRGVGIYAFPTLIEAATIYLSPSQPLPNLTALGL